MEDQHNDPLEMLDFKETKDVIVQNMDNQVEREALHAAAFAFGFVFIVTYLAFWQFVTEGAIISAAAALCTWAFVKVVRPHYLAKHTYKEVEVRRYVYHKAVAKTDDEGAISRWESGDKPDEISVSRQAKPTVRIPQPEVAPLTEPYAALLGAVPDQWNHLIEGTGWADIYKKLAWDDKPRFSRSEFTGIVPHAWYSPRKEHKDDYKSFPDLMHELGAIQNGGVGSAYEWDVERALSVVEEIMTGLNLEIPLPQIGAPRNNMNTGGAVGTARVEDAAPAVQPSGAGGAEWKPAMFVPNSEVVQ